MIIKTVMPQSSGGLSIGLPSGLEVILTPAGVGKSTIIHRMKKSFRIYKIKRIKELLK
jgi:putative ribosome biogenesis GTPase RsgA